MTNATPISVRRLTTVLVAASTMAFALSGCSGLREAMGIDKVSPDEFAIVTKAPLVMPPDYNLRPPAPGSIRADLAQPQEAAQNVLFGRESTPVADGVVTAGEYALLTQTGAENADPNIRAVLTTDATEVAQKDRYFTDRILFWRNNDPSGYDATVVDAAAEADRIRENQDIGRPVTAGETPTITKDRGIF